LLAEISRVVAGPLYIKDHVQAGWLDRARLSVLDFIGNIPFGGMVSADYLSDAEWRALAAGAGYRIAETVNARYRNGPFAMLFPNRLETTMRWEMS
jgi:predicted alpha-1,6-mannanase (GH76 family)